MGVGGFIFLEQVQDSCIVSNFRVGTARTVHSFSGTYFLCFDVSKFQVASEPVVKIES